MSVKRICLCGVFTLAWSLSACVARSRVVTYKIQMSLRSVCHVLDVVVAVVFIKAPILNSDDEDSGKLNVSCGKHVVIQNKFRKSETDRINAGNYGR